MKEVSAVSDISLSVDRGESLAFIGPNGAGKSTTIKMLTGILRPTVGTLTVLGKSPLTQRRELAKRIGTVFGQRSQLVFNLPLTDSFGLSASMYGLSDATAKRRIAVLIDRFALGDFVSQPVRKLSLGQRMRAEVANALIHEPDIIFLDEPTIGLDIVAKRALRETIRKVNTEQGTTIFLTSHDVGDIEEVCDRTVIINHGQIMLDTHTSDLKLDYLTAKTITVVPIGALPPRAEVAGVKAQVADGQLLFSIDTTKLELAKFIPQLFAQLDVQDITVSGTPLEDIIHDIYSRAQHVG
jgi:ABC-2 type transport system ATP-binding protein